MLNRMKELIKILNEASFQYYNSDKTIMSDKEFDIKLEELKALEKETNIILSNSPTQNVGAPILNGINKINISDKPMLSLDKCTTIEEIESFAKNQNVVASIKCDGLSCRIIYENGVIVSANTRGDSLIGADITEHIKHFINVPLTIPTTDRLVVDGEAIIYKYDFDRINAKGEFKNPRNLASGTLASLDTNLSYIRCMNFILWDVIESNLSTKSYSKIIKSMEEYGFTVVPNILTKDNFNIINNRIFEEANRLGIPIDGVVYKYDDITFNTTRTAKFFNNAIAFKFYDEEAETELRAIEYDVSRQGILTPVAVFNEVELEGSINTRASLHNLSIMEELLGKYPEMRQKIWVKKSHQIIPQVSRAEYKNDIPHDHCINIPDYCPICFGNTEVRTSDAGIKMLYCANPECSGKLSQRVDHFLGKKGLDAKGISRATIDKLVEWDWIKEIKDVFTLDSRKREWEKQPGFGEKSVDKILASIESAKHCTLESVIAGAGIPLTGKTIAKDLANKFKTYDAFRGAVKDTAFSFEIYDGYGYEINKALKKFDYTELDYIVNEFLTIEEVKDAGPATDTVKGLIFCITGKLSKARDLIKKDIEAAGGKVGSSVTGKTNYLVANAPEDTTKYKTALDKGIPIITEAQLMEMLG